MAETLRERIANAIIDHDDDKGIYALVDRILDIVDEYDHENR